MLSFIHPLILLARFTLKRKKSPTNGEIFSKHDNMWQRLRLQFLQNFKNELFNK